MLVVSAPSLPSKTQYHGGLVLLAALVLGNLVTKTRTLATHELFHSVAKAKGQVGAGCMSRKLRKREGEERGVVGH
jgi:hypothetical protein